MIRSPSRAIAVLAATGVALALAMSSPAEARQGRKAALITGGIVGAVVAGTLLGAAARPAPPPPVYVAPVAPPPPPRVEVIRECRFAVRRVWIDANTFQDQRVRVCD